MFKPIEIIENKKKVPMVTFCRYGGRGEDSAGIIMSRTFEMLKKNVGGWEPKYDTSKYPDPYKLYFVKWGLEDYFDTSCPAFTEKVKNYS